jgi:CHAT domain-containing protein
MATPVQELEDCFQMTLTEILASNLLDDYEVTSLELSDKELLAIKYMYEINKNHNMVYIYDKNFTLTSTHIFYDPKIKLTDQIALQLIKLEEALHCKYVFK